MLEDLIWHSLLTADMNTRYWGRMARRYACRDKWAKFLLAFTASGTVASWGIWKDFEVVWKALSALSAVVAIALPILDWSKNVEKMSVLKGQWDLLLNEYEFLLLKLDENPNDPGIAEKYERLKREEVTSGTSDSTLPDNPKLLAQCQRDVLASRGLMEDWQEG